MPIDIPRSGEFSAFALILDINRYSEIIDRGGDAQFTRDVLAGGIVAVEQSGGEVIAFMGDAFLAVLDNAEKVFECCVGIAKDIDGQCEYLSQLQKEDRHSYSFSPGGPGAKIGIEFGWLDASTISSRYLGEQTLIAGTAVNHASRILAAGRGNRCNIGPEAVKHGMYNYHPDGPFKVRGKEGEEEYEYYELSLADIWIEGLSDRTYWG